MKKITINYILNLTYEMLLIFVPLITAPYLSRVLNPDGIGQFSYCNSIVFFFTTAITFGFTTYSQRRIAQGTNDAIKNNSVIAIIVDKICLCIIVSLIYIILILLNVFSGYEQLLRIMLVNILVVPFDISFYFQGNENFKIIVFRNIVIKILTIISIFIFVNNYTDLWIYVLINTLSVVVSNFSLRIPFLKKMKKTRVKINISMLTSTFLDATKFFIPAIAISISTMIDNTLIGVLVSGETEMINDGVIVIVRASDVQNGFYSQSSKIVKMALTIISSLSFVILPRNSKEFKNGNINNAKRNFTRGIKLVSILGFAVTIGLMSISSNLVPWFLGDGYEDCVNLVILLCPMIMFTGITGMIGYTRLIPKGKENLFTITVVFTAIANVIFSSILIPEFGATGAIIGTLIGEFVGCLLSIFFIRNDISIKSLVSQNIKYLFFGFFMGSFVYLISLLFEPTILNTILLIIFGVAIYSFVLFAFKDAMINNFLSKIFHIKRRKK